MSSLIPGLGLLDTCLGQGSRWWEHNTRAPSICTPAFIILHIKNISSFTASQHENWYKAKTASRSGIEHRSSTVEQRSTQITTVVRGAMAKIAVFYCSTVELLCSIPDLDAVFALYQFSCWLAVNEEICLRI